MSKRLLTAEDVRKLLEREVERIGSQRAAARQAGVSVQFLSKVLAGTSPPGEKLPAWLGLEPIEMRWQRRSAKKVK